MIRYEFLAGGRYPVACGEGDIPKEEFLEMVRVVDCKMKRKKKECLYFDRIIWENEGQGK